MLHDPKYQAKWESKLGWYNANGFVENDNLFITRDEADTSGLVVIDPAACQVFCARISRQFIQVLV